MSTTPSATQSFIDKGIESAEGDEAILDFISNQNIQAKPQPQWGATANGWAQTAIIRK